MKNSRVLRTQTLELRFIQQRDRWAHEIAWLATGHANVLWRSREGGDECWPASPPFQDLHIEQASNTKQIAFLVGSTSGAHWSASVEADTAADLFRFDMACRVKTEPERLGCCYEWGGLSEGLRKVRFHVEPVAVDNAPRCQVHYGPAGSTVTVDPGAGSLPRTVRWSYLIHAAVGNQVEVHHSGG